MKANDMIKHHPSEKFLHQFVDGQLPASLSAAVAIHLDYCPHCAEIVQQHTEQHAQQCFDLASLGKQTESQQPLSMMQMTDDLMAMMNDITADERQDEPLEAAKLTIKVKDQMFDLPRTLNNMAIDGFSGFGKISRAKIDLGEGEVHSHLLYMAPKGEVPKHTHEGFELTLLLEGEFSDDAGDYKPGDFILLDGKHNHQPYSENGCLCMTVVSDALRFTEGFSRLLNPVGRYIY